ncbi:hypothetical protein DFA_10590 [Cavenderia fasciculata]|uniref:Ubiquitin-like domain-containing protein n=1 Tax=Cavenderia fasciculata TaxID=261658 RepID=F4QAM8_CACFS|nr:uncharacterized protein DFA_10590 [Cavenderia fasciculata]EGG15747.1 hypothetical protein DFA_10590 [Cavenderia fasciculata]|eukprot:XP_004354494.1 hypothetical protein DFA_10590 [Cavenderia fasciculata]
MKIYCAPLDKTILIDCKVDNTTIFQLKGLIQKRLGAPPTSQIIHIKHKGLSPKYDKRILSTLKLTNDSKVEMFYNIDGGCGGCDICGTGCIIITLLIPIQKQKEISFK